MRLTPYKIARIKLLLPEGDKKEIDKQMKAGKFEPETKSRLDKLARFLTPKRLKNKNGCGGSSGLNRRKQKKKNIIAELNRVVDEQKNKTEENDRPD